MRIDFVVPGWATRVAAAAAVVAATLLLVGWWAGQAQAAHNPSGTVHACVSSNGGMRISDSCRANESPLVLATEGVLQAAETRIAALEADNTALNTRVGTLETDNAALDTRVATLETDNAALSTRVGTLEATLAGVTRSQDAAGRDTLTFTGMNVQVVNGTDTTTGDPNGLGNLIIGYNTPRVSPDTDPAVDRAGSHYLVVGDRHHWTRFGGILAGQNNTASGNVASVTGGQLNTASGPAASVTGGFGNTASGNWASVTGGEFNTASGYLASVTSGQYNTASGYFASVTGGFGNTASGNWASVAGGRSGVVADAYDSRIGNTDFHDN